MKKSCFLAVCLLLSVFSFAQRKSMSVDFYKDTDYGTIQLVGKMTYTYVVSEKGESLKDGPLSISSKCGPTQVSVWPYTVKIQGSYTSSANYSKGNLNGAVSSNYSVSVNKLGRNPESGVDKITFSGYFKNGLPHGAFKVSRSDSRKSSLTANYSNGALVGTYSCNLLDEDGNVRKISGSLTQSSKPTGSWSVQSGDLRNKSMTFQNGILISETVVSNSALSPENYSTPPSVVAFAKKYAAGTISKEQLKENGILIRTDSLELGEYARVAILRDSGFEWDKLRGYDLSMDNKIGYTYLDQVPYFTKEGFEKALEELKKMAADKTYSAGVTEIGESDGDKCVWVNTSYDDYVTARLTVNKRLVYLTNEQVNAIVTALQKIRESNAVSLLHYMKLEVETEDELNAANLETLIRLCQNVEEKYKDAKNKLKVCEFNKEYYSDLDKQYVTVSSEGEYSAYLEGIKSKINEKIKAVGASEQITRKFIMESNLSNLKNNVDVLKSAVNISNDFAYDKTPTSILYGNDSFDEEGMSEYWRLDAKDAFKAICPIIACELEDVIFIDGKPSEIILKITKKGKKKEGNTVYQVPFKMSGAKISVKDMDLTKAKKVE